MMKRVRRIYPGFLVAVAICAVAVVPAYSTIMKVDAVEAMKTLGASLILKAYFPQSNVFYANVFPGAVNGSLWSISYEFWCYIGVAALGVAGLATRGRLLLALLIAVLLARVCMDMLDWKPKGGHLGYVFGSPYMWAKILPSFLIGMAFHAYASLIPRSRTILALATVGAIASAHLNPHMASLTVAPALAYIIFYLAFSEVRLPNAAAHGDFSYGAYLYAFPIQQMLAASLGHQMSFAGYFIASAVLAVAAGAVSWYMVERWFQDRPAPRRRMDAALAAE